MLYGPNRPLIIDGETIEIIGYMFPTKSFKLVGVLLDDSLNWNGHAMYVRAKVSRTNFALAMAKRLLPEHIKGMVYNSLFKCHLEYCFPI